MRKEIHSVLGKDELPTMALRPKLPLVNAVINEVTEKLNLQ